MRDVQDFYAAKNKKEATDVPISLQRCSKQGEGARDADLQAVIYALAFPLNNALIAL